MADMLLQATAVSEVKQLMGQTPPERLTGVEILAVVAILRSAKERLDASQAALAPVLELVRPDRLKRTTRRAQ
ncbi:hypothetical protein [Mycobacterium europaeum]|nr:hypothetical protein [Mycobacterium europaeum]